MAKPSTKGLLKEILSDELERVYVSISSKAVEWAVAGFIDEANSLLQQLWSFNIAHSRELWLPDEGLQVLWTVSGKQPQNIPFAFGNIIAIEEENWLRIFYACGDEKTRQNLLRNPFSAVSNSELFIKAINAGYDGSEKPEDILEALRRYIASGDAVGHHYFHAATCGALLAAKNDLSKEAASCIKMWGEGYKKYWYNYTVAYLARDRKTASYLLKGILAPVFRLTSNLCKQETTEIIQALSARMLNGRTLVYNKLSWKQLLGRISKRAIGQKTMEFSAEILAKKTLTKPPATDAEIRKAEQRLHLVFPDDYRKFLLTSDGFESFSDTGVTLSPVDKVDLLINFDPEIIDIWTANMHDADPSFSKKLRSSLIVGGHKEEQQLLLIPLEKANWECWHFSSWRPGEAVYPGFRFYMEDELKSLEDDLFAD